MQPHMKRDITVAAILGTLFIAAIVIASHIGNIRAANPVRIYHVVDTQGCTNYYLEGEGSYIHPDGSVWTYMGTVDREDIP